MLDEAELTHEKNDFAKVENGITALSRFQCDPIYIKYSKKKSIIFARN